MALAQCGFKLEKEMTKEEIKQIRLSLKLSQKQFGELIGYSRQHLSFVERGERVVGVKLVKAVKLIK